ncbi:hypothetical protein [Pseudomonas phage D6]|nr:hypothetical protein [Pseudomonas phage D6]
MASSIAVVFMTVMVGISGGSNSRPPVPVKETTVIQGSNAMAVCRRMESNFHMGVPAASGEVKISVDKYGSDMVRRESSCAQITL